MKTGKNCEQKMKGKKQRLKLESALLKCGLRKSGKGNFRICGGLRIEK